MENKMKEVAKLLGVELGEEFGIDNWFFKYKLTKDVFMCWSDYLQQWNYSGGIEDLLTGEKKIVKIPKPILDEKEKEYLSSVIKPFRDTVISIAKRSAYNNLSYIAISLKKYLVEESVTLPYFEQHKMYKNMKLDKVYTLEELDL